MMDARKGLPDAALPVAALRTAGRAPRAARGSGGRQLQPMRRCAVTLFAA